MKLNYGMKYDYKYILSNIPGAILGIVFTISGIGKFFDKTDAVNLVKVVSEKIPTSTGWENEIVLLTILVELILAGLLFSKKKLFIAYIFSFLFVGTFTVAIGLLYHDGVSLSSCGCFGAFGFSGGIEITLGRNVVLLCLIVTGYLIEIQNESITSK